MMVKRKKIGMKKILIPTDFSVQSNDALDFAQQLVDTDDGQLIVLHAVDTPQLFDSVYLDTTTASVYMNAYEEKAKDQLEMLERKYQNTNVKIRTVVSKLPLIDAINEIVEKEDVEAIVMGTKGASGLKELIIGSNTERVVRNAPCPVFSLPQESKVQKINNIVVPIDAKEISEQFIIAIMDLQRAFEAQLHFVWVNTPHVIENEETMTRNFENFLSKRFIGKFDFKIKRDVLPENCILSYAEEIDADMIAMSTHQRRGIAHLFCGSVTEDICNHSDIPVWAFPITKEDSDFVRLDDYEVIEYGEFLL